MSESLHCWQCGGWLGKHPTTGRLIFKLVRGMRVHKICEPDAKVAAGLEREPLPDPGPGGRTEPLEID